MTLLRVIVGLSVLACASGCPEKGCDALPAGLDHDRCVYEHVMSLAGADYDTVVAEVGTIQDPVVRATAIFDWVRDHGRELGQGRAVTLCNTLEEPGRGTCLRRLGSVHLQR